MNRPYFETQVVKVKKKEKEWTPEYCPCCGAKREAEKPKGNYVNGENLDKIKFPCFCRWADNGWIGMLVKDWRAHDIIYTLVRVDQQTNVNHTYAHFKSLRELIEKYNIRILKGKIIIFEG